MGKSLPCTTSRLQQFARFTSSSNKLNEPKRPISKNTPKNKNTHRVDSNPSKWFVESEKLKLKMEKNNSFPEKQTNNNRIPLAMVVSDCAKRWFQDTLKEAKGGDITMQVLVGQMYCTGYGIPKDPQKTDPDTRVLEKMERGIELALTCWIPSPGTNQCHLLRLGRKCHLLRLGRKGKAWLTRASRTRSSVWRVGSKRPGYNASDSDSDEPKEQDL